MKNEGTLNYFHKRFSYSLPESGFKRFASGMPFLMKISTLARNCSDKINKYGKPYISRLVTVCSTK